MQYLERERKRKKCTNRLAFLARGTVERYYVKIIEKSLDITRNDFFPFFKAHFTLFKGSE